VEIDAHSISPAHAVSTGDSCALLLEPFSPGGQSSAKARKLTIWAAFSYPERGVVLHSSGQQVEFSPWQALTDKAQWQHGYSFPDVDAAKVSLPSEIFCKHRTTAR
jgi:hypothetical protein